MPNYDGTMTFYDSFSIAGHDGTIDIDGDTLKVALMSSSYTPNVATDVAFSGLSGELSTANGYTAGGQALTSVTFTETSGTATLDAADTVWSATGGSIVARRYVIYSDTATGDDLICAGLIDYTDADVTTTNGNQLTLAWNTSGIFTVQLVDA